MPAAALPQAGGGSNAKFVYSAEDLRGRASPCISLSERQLRCEPEQEIETCVKRCRILSSTASTEHRTGKTVVYPNNIVVYRLTAVEVVKGRRLQSFTTSQRRSQSVKRRRV